MIRRQASRLVYEHAIARPSPSSTLSSLRAGASTSSAHLAAIACSSQSVHTSAKRLNQHQDIATSSESVEHHHREVATETSPAEGSSSSPGVRRKGRPRKSRELRDVEAEFKATRGRKYAEYREALSQASTLEEKLKLKAAFTKDRVDRKAEAMARLQEIRATEARQRQREARKAPEKAEPSISGSRKRVLQHYEGQKSATRKSETEKAMWVARELARLRLHEGQGLERRTRFREEDALDVDPVELEKAKELHKQSQVDDRSRARNLAHFRRKQETKSRLRDLETNTGVASLDDFVLVEEQKLAAERRLNLQRRHRENVARREAEASTESNVENDAANHWDETIAQEADPYHTIDEQGDPLPLEHVPYLGRNERLSHLRYLPLWQILEQDENFLNQYTKEEQQYMYSHLPPADTWTSHNIQGQRMGAFARARYFLTHKDTISKFVDRMGLDELSAANGGKKVTVIEAVPGAGTITRELLSRSSVGQVIALEEQAKFRHWTEGLAEDPTVVDSERRTAKDKLHVLGQSGYDWATLDKLEEKGHLKDFKPIRYQSSAEAQGPPPPLVFVAQLPNSVLGDQFFVQIMSAAAYGGWLFKYGRVKIICVIPETMARKALAPPKVQERAKISVLSRVISHCKILLPCIGIQPRAAHIYPPTLKALTRATVSRLISNDQMASPAHHVEMCGFEFIPRERQMWGWRQAAGVKEDFNENDDSNNIPQEYNQGIVTEEYESLEFLMRNLFVLKRHPIIDTLERTYPGAKSILSRLSGEFVQAKNGRFPSVAPFSRQWNSTVPSIFNEQLKQTDPAKTEQPLLFHPASKLAPMPKLTAIPPQTQVDALTDEQWISLARVFERWPFRPSVLYEDKKVDGLPTNSAVPD
ncbi:unnamed protein product [Sympodiomycopsis kandeliae]